MLALLNLLRLTINYNKIQIIIEYIWKSSYNNRMMLYNIMCVSLKNHHTNSRYIKFNYIYLRCITFDVYETLL